MSIQITGRRDEDYGDGEYGDGFYGALYPYTTDTLVENFDNEAVVIRDDDDVDHLLQSIAIAIKRIDYEIDEQYGSRFVETASDEQLERLGEEVGVVRRNNEDDSEYRRRVLGGYAKASSDTTYDVFTQLVLNVLETSAENVEIDLDPSEEDGPHIYVISQVNILEDSTLTIEDINSMLRDAVPMGHNVSVVTYGTFEFASDSYTPPSGSGFGEGTFAGTIN